VGPENNRPVDELRQLVNGYQVSQAISVATRLGVADLLADGTRSCDELARETGADADALYRLLRALAAVGVLREEDGHRFALTELGKPLRSDVPGSLAGWAAFVGRPVSWQAWSALLHSVRTGENAFRHVHGTDVWSWRAERPEENAAFDGAMASLTGGVNQALLAAYDFGRFGAVVDVGGGNGTLLASLLAAFSEMKGILFDQPHVVAAAEETLEAAGVAGRCRIVAGSFFDGVPEGGDAYVLKAIVHDWEDAEAVAILRACRRAASADATLLVLERDLGLANEAPAAKLSDLNMLVNPGGRERSVDEYAELLDAAGFRLVGTTPTASWLSVVEAVPV
jgi:O-methyltransferase domain/Dimerisation domain